MDNLPMGILLIGIMILMLGLSGDAMDQQAGFRCAELARQEVQFPGFFYADWEKEMCNIN